MLFSPCGEETPTQRSLDTARAVKRLRPNIFGPLAVFADETLPGRFLEAKPQTASRNADNCH
jgi:hypothetical protein